MFIDLASKIRNLLYFFLKNKTNKDIFLNHRKLGLITALSDTFKMMLHCFFLAGWLLMSKRLCIFVDGELLLRM
jgi:hypothetical protein